MSGTYHNRRPAHGLTLIELVVVVAILTLLGGLVVQTLPNLMKRTHLSKCADTITALNKSWAESYALHGRYPDGLDSLLDSTGSTFPKLTPGLSSLLSSGTLSSDEVNALRALGVRTVVDLSPSVANVTYDSAPLGITGRTIDTSGNVAILATPGSTASTYWTANPLGLKRHVNSATGTTVKYVVFGVGPNCTGIGAGKLIQEAPVHFGADDTINPNNVYQRYLTVYSLVTTNTGKVTAYFEAMAGNDVDGPSSAEAHIRQFHEGQAEGA
ncbi:MAG: prepilin-type N-terminal cleavage/methylation domain-containing protein [Planctomycetales bacterium]|nr:prepilin-type N-terminal cleavage/methylation domain-containing protein [Planctomycetales bacterium]MBN8625092.1 prepilin-type N-terminal cleavage/methylation domain-containing protein [Planctomycetota bacterium]